MDFSTEVPMLVVTTDPSWQHFSKWWAELTAPQLEATPEIKAKVKELTKDAKTDDEKIKALYDFVAQDIRYRGLGVGPRTGYTPRKANETFTSRWGVCRDVSILLTSMLREAGIQAYPVLTNVGDPVLPKIAYDGFNHAIVAMPNKARRLDVPRSDREEQQLAAARLRGRAGHAGVDDEGRAADARSPRSIRARTSATRPRRRRSTPTARCTRRSSSRPRACSTSIVRSTAAMLPQDQQKEAVEQILHHALPDAKLVSYNDHERARAVLADDDRRRDRGAERGAEDR